MEIVHVQPNWKGLTQICHNMDRMPFRLYELKFSYFALMQGKNENTCTQYRVFGQFCSFSIHLSENFWSLVVHCLLLSQSVSLSVSKVFTFSTFAPEQLAQFSTNIGAKYCTFILGWVGIEFLMECCLVYWLEQLLGVNDVAHGVILYCVSVYRYFIYKRNLI